MTGSLEKLNIPFFIKGNKINFKLSKEEAKKDKEKPVDPTSITSIVENAVELVKSKQPKQKEINHIDILEVIQHTQLYNYYILNLHTEYHRNPYDVSILNLTKFTKEYLKYVIKLRKNNICPDIDKIADRYFITIGEVNEMISIFLKTVYNELSAFADTIRNSEGDISKIIDGYNKYVKLVTDKNYLFNILETTIFPPEYYKNKDYPITKNRNLIDAFLDIYTSFSTTAPLGVTDSNAVTMEYLLNRVKALMQVQNVTFVFKLDDISDTALIRILPDIISF